MKKLSLLKTWMKVLFLLCLLVIVFVPGFIMLYIISPEMVPPGVSISGFKTLDAARTIIALLVYGGCCLFVYAMYLFREVLELFGKNQIFHEKIVENFRKIGNYIWYGMLLTTIPFPVYRLFTEYPVHVSFDFDEVTYVLFTGSLGLFFQVLSEVFKRAKQLKEENDLTV